MTSLPLRFLHTSDWHLEQPVAGMADVPEALRDTLIEAPYLAVERVIETALSEEVDFLVLCGDAIDAERAGPRGMRFLTDQFTRLADRNIAVYWCPGSIDPLGSWPAAVRLPENVHRFSSDRPEEVVHCREGAPVARLIGRGAGIVADATVDVDVTSPHYTILAAYGDADACPTQPHVDFAAWGGRQQTKTLREAPHVIHYAGSPQGRKPRHRGPHGCTLVGIDALRHTQMRFIPTDLVRFERERIRLTRATTRGQLEARMHERLETLATSSAGVDVLVTWTIGGTGTLLNELRRGRLADELVDGLRQRQAVGGSVVWTIEMDVQPPERWPSVWQEEETLLGSFLREAQRHLDEDQWPASEAAEQEAADALGITAQPGSSGARRRLWRDVEALGVDLLRGEDARP